jgi:hypothetical protein
MVRRLSVLQHRRAPLLWVSALRHLQELVLHQKRIQGMAQEILLSEPCFPRHLFPQRTSTHMLILAC